MRSRSVRWVAGGLLVTATAAGTGLAYGAANDGHGKLALHAVQVSERQLALGQADSPVGSEFIDHWAFDDDGRPAGSLDTTCQVVTTSSAGSTAQCTATAALAKGQLVVQGLVAISEDAPGDFDLAITGGTGAYRTARGSVHIHPVDATTEVVEFEVVG
jgi:hypothetical protein